MRINQYVARATGFSRRQADNLVSSGQVRVNGYPANLGQSVLPADVVMLGDQQLELKETILIMLNKPAGYICSRRGQGSKTIYDLVPKSMSTLFSIGRLDKDSSGLILLTSDGELAQKLSHPRFEKIKTYTVRLNRDLSEVDRRKLVKEIILSDGPSRFLSVEGKQNTYKIKMAEGRNRQIRRAFAALDYRVDRLHRTAFGPYLLGNLAPGRYKRLI